MRARSDPEHTLITQTQVLVLSFHQQSYLSRKEPYYINSLDNKYRLPQLSTGMILRSDWRTTSPQGSDVVIQSI